MEVRLYEHEGVCLSSGERVVVHDEFGPQYRVYVDGVGCGYIGSRPGSDVLLTETRFSEAQREEIRKKVGEIRGIEVAEVKQPPEVDPELLKAKDDGIDPNDFD